MTDTTLIARPRVPRRKRARLRAAVLHQAARVGWSVQQVVGFTEGLTRRPWGRCDHADFARALRELRSLAVAPRAARTRGPRRGRGEPSGGADAPDA